ncbi:chaperonin: PROVISIONAL [Gigaspora margarita]|uniref:Chaperonin: PROVISIONAL n=1 Tax=Gigaspora margarita TaxID=4874 RepID=A0A8H4A1Q1_GIGMA|nr:chaperonin: PROVISIONAL [Gigaspora margarita]
MQFRSLDKKELDLVLMNQLMAFEYNQTNEDSKQKFNYQFNSDIKLCKNTYLKLIGVGKVYLIQINKSLKTKRHPSPGRLQHDIQSIIYLPTNEDYTKELLPYIKFMTPGTDLCETCETLKAEIRSANYNEKKELIQKRLDDHKQKAKIKQEYYHNNILTSTILPDTMHICYDWAQNVPVPYSPQQIGMIYFKSALQAYIFGICNTGQNPAQQLNYIIAENEFSQGTVINTVDDVQKVVNKSTKNGANNGICYNNGEE